MKKYLKVFFAAAALFAAAITASAIPAQPGTFKYKQPDGTVIELRLHGDEFFHWTTRVSDGAVVVLGSDGFYRPGTLDIARREAGRTMRTRTNSLRAINNKGIRTHNDDPMTHGQRHVPVILVEYADLGFVINNPAESFGNLLNQNGYSANGGTGSVRDYYYDNSHGAFEPMFDVYGPVTLSGKMADYGTDRAANALVEAARALDNQINFADYDYDNDGQVDMLLMYYPGHNPAEHGPEENIWPHQSNISVYNIRLDGKILSRYFCTSELRGSSGARMCGIGTTCHEFAHSLGLPDFYDTDYEENGKCGAVYYFSLMDSGSYLNDGRTPPYFNTEERIFLGWMSDDDVPELPDGNVSLTSVNNEVSYRSYTDTEGEYFLYECRDHTGWDAYLPAGLVVYHVDKSKVRTVGGQKPYNLWADWYTTNNAINAYADHPCYYVIPACDQTSLLCDKDEEYMIFPGKTSTTVFCPMDWEDNLTGTTLSNISYSNGAVSWTTSTTKARTIIGFVKDVDGNPIEGAIITLSKPSAVMRDGHIRIMGRVPESQDTVTGANGSFTIDMSEFEGDIVHLSVAKEGYLPVSKDVTMGLRGAKVTFVMYVKNDGSDSWISYYDDSDDAQWYLDGPNTAMSAICIPAEQLEQFAGRRILEVESYIYCSSVEEMYVIAEAGGQRLLNHKVEQPVCNKLSVIDISDDGLTVPSGHDLYIGIALKNAYNEYNCPFVISIGGGQHYTASFSLDGNTRWKQKGTQDLVFGVHIAEDVIRSYEKLAAQGYNVIYPGDSFTHKAGEVFQLRLFEASGDSKPTSIEWQYDGKAVTDTSVTLTKGNHKVTAKLVLADGRTEVLDLDLSVQ